MRIAIPIAEGKLSPHFGHCKQFALVEVDKGTKKILSQVYVDAPPHQPGLLPNWLAERGAEVIIAGGMGQRALSLFEQNGITVIVGARSLALEDVVSTYLDGTLQTGENVCDH